MVLWLLLPGTAAAQTPARLLGSVVDAETGQALVGVTVSAVPAGTTAPTYGDVTDARGAFTLDGLPAGTYAVTISHLGYAPHVRPGVVLAAGATQRLDVALVPAVVPLGEVLVSSVSRRPERVVEAPAAVQILEAAEVVARPALTVSEHVKGLPGVDVVQTGIGQNRVVVRGFNEAGDPGRLLVLVDHRIAAHPSLRSNEYTLLPTLPADLDRIELVSGPGSALYGPNAVAGVLHVLTASPFEAPGTTLSVFGGERSLIGFDARHAGRLAPRIGYRLTAKYYGGDDWSFVDPVEPDSITLGFVTETGRRPVGPRISNRRDERQTNYGAALRLDFRPTEALSAVVDASLNSVSGISLSGGGAVQVEDWRSSYVQGRVSYGDLFVQAYVNQIDAGDSYFLRNGNFIADESRMFVTQAQHGLGVHDDRLRLTYGLDALLTRPRTQNSLHGRNESDDDLNEFGAYLQAEAALTPRLKAVLAGRLDENNYVEAPIFSPRAALVVAPAPAHHVRLTFNRAYQSIRPLDLFFDITLFPDLAGLPFAVRVRGVPPATGWTFQRDAAGGVGGLYMQSPFTPPGFGGPAARLPAEATLLWPVVVGFFQQQGVDLSSLPPPAPGEVGTTLRLLDVNTAQFTEIAPEDVADIAPLEPTQTTTFEVGYTGVVQERLLVTANLYRQNDQNFPGPIDAKTPNVFFEPASLAAYFARFFPPEAVPGLTEAAAMIPLATITPEEADPADILLTTRSFGDYTHTGLELGLSFFATPRLTVGGSYAYVSTNYWEREAGEPEDRSLNAPRHKGGGHVRYHDAARGLDAGVRLRYVDSFPIRSDLGRGTVDSYAVVDVNARYRMPFDRRLAAALVVQNALDNRHREFIGAAEIGRLAMLRVTYDL